MACVTCRAENLSFVCVEADDLNVFIGMTVLVELPTLEDRVAKGERPLPVIYGDGIRTIMQSYISSRGSCETFCVCLKLKEGKSLSNSGNSL